MTPCTKRDKFPVLHSTASYASCFDLCRPTGYNMTNYLALNIQTHFWACAVQVSRCSRHAKSHGTRSWEVIRPFLEMGKSFKWLLSRLQVEFVVSSAPKDTGNSCSGKRFVDFYVSTERSGGLLVSSVHASFDTDSEHSPSGFLYPPESFISTPFHRRRFEVRIA